MMKNIVRVTRYCSSCRRNRDTWYKSIKPYVVNVTGGVGYYCYECVNKQREKNGK